MTPAGSNGDSAWAYVVLVAATGLAPAPTTGQGAVLPPPRTITLAAGPEYRAGWLHQVLFGRHYRDLWTTSIEVEVLDLAAFAGGLTPLRRGGGGQTRALRLAGADGRHYVFRSVNKQPSWLPRATWPAPTGCSSCCGAAGLTVWTRGRFSRRGCSICSWATGTATPGSGGGRASTRVTITCGGRSRAIVTRRLRASTVSCRGWRVSATRTWWVSATTMAASTG